MNRPHIGFIKPERIELWEPKEIKKAASREAADENILQDHDTMPTAIEQAAEILAVAYEQLRELGEFNIIFNPEDPLAPIQVAVMPQVMERISGPTGISHRLLHGQRWLVKRKPLGKAMAFSMERAGGGPDDR